MRYVLLVLALLALSSSARAQEPDWGAAREIEVTLSNFKFTPNEIVLDAGQPYRLHLVNTANGGHDFDAKRFFAAATIAPTDRAKVKDGGVNVPKGGAVDIRLVAPARGTYDLHCSHFMHSTFGMTGHIFVR